MSLRQEGLSRIEDAILRLLGGNARGLRNAEIAEKLQLRSHFTGKQMDYLTYSVLGGLLSLSCRGDKTPRAARRELIDALVDRL